MTLLIVDDDIPIGNLLEEALAREGYTTLRAYSGTEALMILERERPGLILLDLMLPGLSGEEVLARVHGIPVIVLSAKADTEGKVGALRGGAVDYVTKPFHMKELLARVEAHLRAVPGSSSKPLCFEDIRLTPDTRSVTAAGAEVRLTRTEYAILKLLLQNPAKVMSKSALLDQISLDTPDCTESSLKIHISHLRKKLRDAGSHASIEAVWGIGFRLAAG